MKVYWKKNDYDADIDVLVRVYDNQKTHNIEKELFVGEILFKPHLNREHLGYAAEYPRGLAEAITKALSELKDNDWKVQISNEIPSTVEHLNFCDEHFENRFKQNWREE